MRLPRIAMLAPVRYSIILWVLPARELVWHEGLNQAWWVGSAIVCIAGLSGCMPQSQLAKAALS